MYMEHKISDQEFAEADIKLWEKNSEKPVNEKYINSILDEIKPVAGAKELIDSLQNKGIRTIILSGGIKYLANKWAKKWNIDEVIANDLIDDDRGKLCAIIESKEKIMFLLFPNWTCLPFFCNEKQMLLRSRLDL